MVVESGEVFGILNFNGYCNESVICQAHLAKDPPEQAKEFFSPSVFCLEHKYLVYRELDV